MCFWIAAKSRAEAKHDTAARKAAAARAGGWGQAQHIESKASPSRSVLPKKEPDRSPALFRIVQTSLHAGAAGLQFGLAGFQLPDFSAGTHAADGGSVGKASGERRLEFPRSKQYIGNRVTDRLRHAEADPAKAAEGGGLRFSAQRFYACKLQPLNYRDQHHAGHAVPSGLSRQ